MARQRLCEGHRNQPQPAQRVVQYTTLLTSPEGGAGGEGSLAEFQYHFAQREALETVIYLYDVVGMRQWCEDINRVQSDVKYDFVYVDQENFEKYKPGSFQALIDGFKEYKCKG